MMTSFARTPSRRTLLQTFGMGGAAYFLPTLRKPAYGQGPQKPPQRLIIFYSQHGTLPWLWRPTGSRTNFELSYLLKPLEPYKNDLIILDGLDFKALELPGGKESPISDGHATCQAGSLTANKQINHLSNQKPSRGQGASFDWFLSRRLEALNPGGKSPTSFAEQRYRTYERLDSNPNWGRPFQDDKNQWLIPELEPNVAYNRLFGGALPSMGSDPAAAASILRRKSALDFAAGEFAAVANKVGQVEKQRLEQHTDIIRDLETQLLDRAKSTSACQAPGKPMGMRKGVDDWNLTWDGFTEITRAAFACDLTRVVSFHVNEPDPKLYGGINSSKLGGIDTLHNLVHAIDILKKEAQDKNRLDTAKEYYRIHAVLFKELLDKLSEVKESDGKRLLDHTAVLWCGELGDPNRHTPHNQKWLIAGSCGGALKTGQYMNYDGDGYHVHGIRDQVPSNGDVFTTLAHAMGVKENFGPAGATKGPLGDLLV